MIKTDHFYVYVHKKASDGEIFYVGKGHGNRATDVKSRNKLWKSIVEKHGFTVDIVASDLPESDAFALESEMVRRYGRRNNSTGVLANMTDGGDGSSGWTPNEQETERKKESSKRVMSSVENREKFGNASRMRWVDESYRKKMEAVRNLVNSDPEIKKNASEKRKKNWASDGYRERVGPLISKGLLAVSDKLSAIHKEVQNRPHVKKAQSVRSKERWNDSDYRDKVVKSLPRGSEHHASRSVVNLTTGEKFDTVSSGAKFYGVQVANVQKVLKGERTHTGGHSWAYL